MQDIVETAWMARLDVKVECIMNMKREFKVFFFGDPVAEHLEGIKVAKEYYDTPLGGDSDIVFANCYMKANEICLAPSLVTLLLKRDGGDMVIISVYPAGQIAHYYDRSFGKNLGGMMWLTGQKHGLR